MINWKGCGKKRWWSKLRDYLGICLEGQSEDNITSIKTVGIPGDIRTGHLMNTTKKYDA
jgi:hypothetical protein